MLDKMKRRMKFGGKHKQAEDTMSVASGVSGVSMTSSRSTRFITKLNKSIGRKLSSLQDGRPIFGHHDANSSLDSNGHLAPPTANGSAVVYREGKQNNASSRPSSGLSGIDFSEDSSYPTANRLSTPISSMGQVAQTVGGSPTASTAESFHRANSIRSVASSGFGGSNKPASSIVQKQRNDELAYSQQDLLALVDSLRLELRVKDSRLRDMEEYMDNLISRVMERNPELLAAPLAPDKPKRRYF
ncbi:FIP domain protein [Cooperia oncophora]